MKFSTLLRAFRQGAHTLFGHCKEGRGAALDTLRDRVRIVEPTGRLYGGREHQGEARGGHRRDVWTT